VAEPSAQDLRNAACRAEIAAKQAEAYNQVLRYALGAFGPGWLPSHRHFLVTKSEEDRCRYTQEHPKAAATVYTVKNGAGRKRHFTVEDGKVTECASYEEGFGPMLLEPDTERTITVRGENVHPHKYSLNWACYELYEPRSATQLAALRESRERGKAEREERRFREENPLLVWMDRVKEETESPER
jgi:hypothetical protein